MASHRDRGLPLEKAAGHRDTIALHNYRIRIYKTSFILRLHIHVAKSSSDASSFISPPRPPPPPPSEMTKPGNAAVKPSSSAAKKKALRIEDLQKKVAAMSGQIDGLTKMVDAPWLGRSMTSQRRWKPSLRSFTTSDVVMF